MKKDSYPFDMQFGAYTTEDLCATCMYGNHLNGMDRGDLLELIAELAQRLELERVVHHI